MDGNSSEYNYCNFITRVSHTPVAIHHMTRLADFNAKSRLRSARTVTHHLILSIANSVTFALFSLAGAFPNHLYIPTANPPHRPIIDFQIQHPHRAQNNDYQSCTAAHKQSTKIGRPCVANWRPHTSSEKSDLRQLCLFTLPPHTVKHSSCYY